MGWDDRTRRAVSWALVKGLFPSVLLILASLAMWHIWPRDPRIVSWVLLALSFLLFLKGYFRDWRLRWFTTLLPGVMAQVSFAIQAMVLKVEPIAGPVGMGLLLAGLILGILRGLGHNIFTKDGQLFAKPTLLVMLVWLVTYMVTQSAALFGWVSLTRWGLSGSMFSTVVLVTFSIVLFVRFVWRKSRERKTPVSTPVDQAARTLVVFLLAGGLMFTVPDGPVLAQTTSGEQNQDLVYTATFNQEFQECTRVIQMAGMVSLGKTIAAIGSLIRGNTNDEPDPTIAQLEAAGFDVEVTGTDTTATHARRLGRVDIGNVDIRSTAKIPNKKTGRTDTVTADFQISFGYGHTGSDGVIGGQTRTNQVTTLSGGKKQSTEVLNKWRVVFSPDGTRGAVYLVLGEDDRMLETAREMGYASIPPAYLLTLQTPVSTAAPPVETSPVPAGNEQFTDSSSDGSAGDGEPDDMLSESDVDAVLDAVYAQNLPDAAVAAGLIAGIAMLLAGAGLNLAISVATAIANAAQQGVDDAAQAVAAAAPQYAPMIDPRDGLELEADGDKVYWDDDEGWIDRDKAQQWISEIDVERAQRDWEVEQNQAAWDAGYDQRMWDMTHRNDFEDPTGFYNMLAAYDCEDFIDDHVHMLSPEMQQHVKDNLNGIDWSDPYNLSAEDLNTLGSTANAVAYIRDGQIRGDAAAAEHRKIDRAETGAYLNLLGVGTRIAATAINPVLGVGISGFIGYATGREKHREFDGAVTALASIADIWTGGMSPASILWNSTTGGGIAMAEVGAKGGSWDEMKAAGMMAAGMSALFAAGQKPGVRNLLTSVDDSVKSSLGINGPRAPQVEAPATSLTGSRVPDADGNTVSFLGEGADGTRALGPRPDVDQAAVPGTRPPAMDDLSMGSRAPSMDDGSGAAVRPPDADLGDAVPVRPPGAGMDESGMGSHGPSMDDGSASVRPSDPDLGEAIPVRPPGSGVEDTSWKPGDKYLPPGDAEPPAWVTDRNVEWLNDTDRGIRKAWQDVGAGRTSDAWDQFNNRIGEKIAAGELDRGQVNAYYQLQDYSAGGAHPSGWQRGLDTPGLRDMDAGQAQTFIRNSAASDDPAQQLAPFKNGGQKNMALFEEQGTLPPEAYQLGSRASAAVDDACVSTVPAVNRSFETRTGVRVEKTLIGDSGSSAAGSKPSIDGDGGSSVKRSIRSDNDRTDFVQFNDDDVHRWAQTKYPNLPPKEGLANAHHELTQVYTSHHAAEVDFHLQKNYGVRSEDLGVDLYGGMSSPRPGGPDDLYGAGTTRVRQSVQGQTTVVRPDGSSYQTSGDALVDAEHLARTRYYAADEPMTGFDNVRRMSDADYQRTIQEQIHKVDGLDPSDTTRPQIQDGAKAVQRAAEASHSMGNNPMDPKVVDVAKRIRNNPDNIPKILDDAGMTREQFLTRVQQNVRSLQG